MFTPTRDYKNYSEEYQSAIIDVLESGHFINGPQINQLETRLVNWLGIKNENFQCISCSSGTDALLIALMALGVGPGNEVITVAHTWISSSEVISLLGAKPIFVDIDPETFLMDLNKIQSMIGPKTKGIMVVSLYGQFHNPIDVNKIAKDNGLWVIEDGAQSFGAEGYDLIKSCTWADISTTSFFPSKPLGGYGDSGACFTSNLDLAQKMKAIRNHGGLVRFKHDLIGINGRMDTIQAAVLLVKLKYFNQSLERRREIATTYSRELSDVEGIKVPKIIKRMKSGWAQYSILVDPEVINRDLVVSKLKEKEIAVSIFYPKGLHEQPCFGLVGDQEVTKRLKNTEFVCHNVFNIPIFPELTDQEVNKIIMVVKETIAEIK